MKCKYIYTFLFLFLSIHSVAQHKVGGMTFKPYVGYSLASMFNGDLDFRKSVMAGVDIEKRYFKHLSVSGGVNYAPMGGIYNSSGKDRFVWKHDYIAFPITANWYIFKGFALKTGIQPAISIRNRQESIDDPTMIDRNMEGQLNTFDLTIPVAISYELYKYVLDIRWNIGVTDTGSAEAWKHDYHMVNSKLQGTNFSYVFSIGYQFDW